MTGERQDLEVRIERLERDFSALQSAIISVSNSLEATNRLLDGINKDFRQTRPSVRNCPKCHRKVGPTDTSCGMCSHVFA